MSHFYATIQSHRGETACIGSKASGLYSHTGGWKGSISVYVWHNDKTDEDRYQVSLVPWQSSGGKPRIIATGPLDANTPEFITRDPALGSRDLELIAALRQAKEAFSDLACHMAFADNAPEFNEGGVGYEANHVARSVLAKYDGGV